MTLPSPNKEENYLKDTEYPFYVKLFRLANFS